MPSPFSPTDHFIFFTDFFVWFGDVFSSWMFFLLHQATWPGNHLDDDQGAHDVVEEAVLGCFVP
jgi:hypothetical protein